MESSVSKSEEIPGLVAAGAAEDPGGGQINGPATEEMYNAGGHRRRAPAVAPGRRGAPVSKKSAPGADIILQHRHSVMMSCSLGDGVMHNGAGMMSSPQCG